MVLLFQSTRPIRGATLLLVDAAVGADISIHAPHTGRDEYQAFVDKFKPKFQSTRPIRGATVASLTGFGADQFQSTRPIRGATQHPRTAFFLPSYFNPRAPYGARRRHLVVNAQGRIISIHAPHTGRDTVIHFTLRILTDFNPHAPYGARPVEIGGDTTKLGISIHAPHTGRDSSWRRA